MLESTLHRQLKDYYAQQTGIQEALVDGYLIDVLQEDWIIEIQTRNFYAIRPKLEALLENYKVLLVHPIAAKKWIISQNGDVISRRLSPRRGRIEDVFYELIRFPHLVQNPNLVLEIVVVDMEEFRLNDGKGSWRRKGVSIIDRKILEINQQIRFSTPADFRNLLPGPIEYPFSVRELSSKANIPMNLARRMIYCLLHMGELQLAGRKGRAYLYALT